MLYHSQEGIHVERTFHEFAKACAAKLGEAEEEKARQAAQKRKSQGRGRPLDASQLEQGQEGAATRS